MCDDMEKGVGNILNRCKTRHYFEKRKKNSRENERAEEQERERCQNVAQHELPFGCPLANLTIFDLLDKNATLIF